MDEQNEFMKLILGNLYQMQIEAETAQDRAWLSFFAGRIIQNPKMHEGVTLLHDGNAGYARTIHREEDPETVVGLRLTAKGTKPENID